MELYSRVMTTELGGGEDDHLNGSKDNAEQVRMVRRAFNV